MRASLERQIASHDPNSFEATSHDTPTHQDADLAKINAILDARVRPALQGDGGDIRIISYENNVLKIFYQGACGSCPSSAMGTLYAIQNLLRQEFNPEIVVLAGGYHAAGDDFLHLIRKKVSKYIILPKNYPIEWSKLKEPGILGAALLID